MPVKLKVTQESASAAEQEYLYHEDVITLGRKETNTLLLPDPFKKLVSRRHARIERNGATYFLFDLESQNHTLLNGARLESARPYELRNGDEIGIGDYHIQFFALMLEASPGDSGEVVLHPFVNETNELQRILLRLAEKFARADTNTRADILFQALLEPMQRLTESEMSEIFTRAFSGQNRSGPGVALDEKAPPAPAPSSHVELLEARAMVKQLSIKLEEKEAGLELLREEIRRLKGNATSTTKTDTTSTKPLDTLSMTLREKQVLELMLDGFVQLNRGYGKYVGSTAPRTIRMRDIDMKVRHATSGELYKMFFEPEVAEKDYVESIEALKRLLREIIAHPLALHEGYSGCLKESPRSLLSVLALENLKDEVLIGAGGLRPLLRLMPFLVQRRLLQAYRNKHSELTNEDNSTFAHKHFDPVFHKHYNLRMDAVRANNHV